MARTRFWLPAAAIAAVLLLAGPTPRHVAASSDAAPSKAETVTTLLYPGWNMVGWLGPATPMSDLFEVIPELEQVLAWDPESGRYRGSTRTNSEHDLTVATRGDGLWLEVDASAPVEWTRTISDEYVVLSLQTGWNLVGWTGEDGTSVADALVRLGDTLGGAARWDTAAGRFRTYYPGAEATNDLDALSRGDALWIHVGQDSRWAHPGTGRVVFEFADGIPPDVRAATREEMARVMAFYAERLGIYLEHTTVFISETDSCWYDSLRDYLKVSRTPSTCAAHEYFHGLQFKLAQGRSVGPAWLQEGSATYGEKAYDGALDSYRTVASAGAIRVASIRNPASTRTVGGVYLNYHLGFLAADWLVSQAGEASLLDYYRLLPSSDSWEAAFAGAFGMSIRTFYDSFKVHRADIAPPLPHLTDEIVRPVVVFLGDVPAKTRADMRQEVATVHTFLTERFGAGPADYSIYAGPHWTDVADHANRLGGSAGGDDQARKYSVPLVWDGGCTVPITGLIVHALDCERPLDHQSYINSHIRALLVDKEHDPLSPMWIEAGGAIYVGLSYISGSPSAIGEELARHSTIVQQSQASLQELAPKELFGPKGHGRQETTRKTQR